MDTGEQTQVLVPAKEELYRAVSSAHIHFHDFLLFLWESKVKLSFVVIVIVGKELLLLLLLMTCFGDR